MGCDDTNKIYLSEIIYDCSPFVCAGFPELSLEPCDKMCDVMNVIMSTLCELKNSALGFTNTNVGGGAEVFKSSVGVIENFRTLVAASANVTIVQTADTITIDSVGGETNTASNVGTGLDVFKQKVGVDFEFHKILAGTNVTSALVGDDITINVPIVGETNTASNVGASGVGVFFQKTGLDFEFKKFTAGYGINVTDGGTTVNVEADLSYSAIEFEALAITLPVFAFPYTVTNVYSPAELPVAANGAYILNITGNATLEMGDVCNFFVLERTGAAYTRIGFQYPHSIVGDGAIAIRSNFSITTVLVLSAAMDGVNLGFDKSVGTPVLHNINISLTRIN